jgi:Peptidase family S41
VRLSRRAWIGGLGGTAIVGAAALSIPGGGPKTYLGGTPPKYDFAPFDSLYSPDEMRAELDWLVATMYEVGAKPFAFSDEASFRRTHEILAASLLEPAHAGRFFLAAARLFASLNDGHVSLELGRDYETWRYERNSSGFPLLLRLTPFGLFVDVQSHEQLPVGTRVSAIDDIPSSTLITEIVALQGGQSLLERTALMGAYATYFLSQWFYASNRLPTTFRIDAVTPRGGMVRVTVPSATSRQLDEVRAIGSGQHDPNSSYTFSRIDDGRVGYIDYRRCDDRPAFRTFLKRTFADIHSRPIAGLIVDIRANGGGDSTLNDDLWSYLTDEPFSQGGGVTFKVSDRLKREHGFWRYNIEYLPPCWFLPDGSLFHYDFTNLGTVRPSANPLRYAGPVFLLIGLGTFSSALSCAEVAKRYRLATIVGQTTSPVNHTGEVYQGYSPRMGIGFQFTTKYYSDSPFRDAEGVEPDVTIVPTEEQTRNGGDPVLEYAVRRISAGVGRTSKR